MASEDLELRDFYWKFFGKHFIQRFFSLPYWYTLCFLPSRLLTKPIHAQIESTNKCNVKCIMCAHGLIEDKNTKNLTLNEFKRILQQIPSIKSVDLHGLGEPLLNPELFAIIKYAKKKGKRVGFITNATLLSDDNIIKIIESGLNCLCFSIDAANNKSYENIRAGADFDKVITNIRRFMQLKKKKANVSIEIFAHTAVIRNNVQEIPDIMKMVSGMGIKYLCLTSIQTLLDPRLQEIRLLDEEFNKLKELRPLSDKLDLTTIFFPSLKKTRNKIPPCLWPWQFVYITASGFLTPCCYIPFPDSYCFGNIFKEDFKDIWNNKQYREFRTLMKTTPPGYCVSCPYKRY